MVQPKSRMNQAKSRMNRAKSRMNQAKSRSTLTRRIAESSKIGPRNPSPRSKLRMTNN